MSDLTSSTAAPFMCGTEACAFVATSFGFGPVSKAVSIAQELKRQAAHLRVDYFGAGIAYEYAHQSGCFDNLYQVDVDRRETLVALVPRLTSYGAVFSVLNLELLPLWRGPKPPLYFVDSLAWMWRTLPAGIEHVAAYFVQDFLTSPERIRQWSQTTPLVLVAPIETASRMREEPARSSHQLLVNFSGCANPFAAPAIYEKYAFTLANAVRQAAGSRYQEIIFSCNKQLAAALRQSLPASPGMQIGQFAHQEFLALLRSSALVLSAPGVTTTLEALASRTPLRFLLPQNDSQARLSELYRTLLGDHSCMAFSRFGAEFEFPSTLPEGQAITLALNHLQEILETRQPQILDMLRELIAEPPRYNLSPLEEKMLHRWGVPGQQSIAAYLLSDGKDHDTKI